MSEARDRERILADRLDLVLAIGEANAARQRSQAAFGGAQIEMMRVETESEREQETAVAAEVEALSAIADAEARIDALERRLAELDAELANAGR